MLAPGNFFHVIGTPSTDRSLARAVSSIQFVFTTKQIIIKKEKRSFLAETVEVRTKLEPSSGVT